MKEITLQELLNMADAAAHDGIGELWNQKTIHYLVVFTSETEDFEIIGVGPTLPCATLEAAATHSIPGKKPELFVKCPGALAGRLQPKLAPGHLGLRPPLSPISPTLKGRTTVPFPNRQPPPAPAGPEPSAPKTAVTAEPPAKMDDQIPKSEISVAPSALPTPTTTEVPTELVEREKALQRRAEELTLLAEKLQARETVLREREAVIAAFAERLRNPPRGG